MRREAFLKFPTVNNYIEIKLLLEALVFIIKYEKATAAAASAASATTEHIQWPNN